MKMIELNQLKKGSLIQRYSDNTVVELLGANEEGYITKRIGEGKEINTLTRAQVHRQYRIFEGVIVKEETPQEEVTPVIEAKEVTDKEIITLKEAIIELGLPTDKSSMIKFRKKLRKKGEEIKQLSLEGYNWSWELSLKQTVIESLKNIL